MDALRFLSPEQVRDVAASHGTPVYVYGQDALEAAARDVLAFPNAFGLTARFAVKALPSGAIMRVFDSAGLHMDASSGYEAERVMAAGIAAGHILLTAQEIPANLAELVERGVEFNACSLHQLRAYGERFPGSEVGVRINPGMGSGHTNRTNVGGPGASFGIWHEGLDEIEAVRAQHNLTITRMHTHIGSGTDSVVWQRCARLSLAIAAKLPDVATLSLGGGFKVSRMDGEASTDLQEIGGALIPDFEEFARRYGRKLHLEVEPGTFLTANAGVIVAAVTDVVSTGAEGYHFIKTDTGMTEILRPSMYGAQHPMTLVPAAETADRGPHDYLVVGHCCESGDILTPAPGDPDALLPRALIEARIGDLLVIGGAGAYCSGMAAKNYNSFPEAAEVLIASDGTPRLIRRRQTLDQMIANEVR